MPDYSLVHKKTGVFIISHNEKGYFNPDEVKLIEPFFSTNDIRKYFVNNNNSEWIIYTDRTTDGIKKYPNLYKHFNRKGVREVLDNIREVKTGRIKYFQLQWPRNKEIFISEKIVCPQRAKSNVFGYSNNLWFGGSGIFFITQRDKSISLKYVLALLNSKLYHLWLYYRGKRKGELLELIKAPLSEIPIKKIPKNDQKPFISIADKILAITKDEGYPNNVDKQARVKELERQIDKMVYELYMLTPEEEAAVREFTDSKGN